MSSQIISSSQQSKLSDSSKSPIIEWRWGKPGTGKTAGVYQKHGYNNVYSKDGTRFWDCYQQEDAILIDNFDGHSFPQGQDLMQLLSGSSYKGQYKRGGCCQINSEFIYITSLYPPDHFWSGDELDYIKSRLTIIEELKYAEVLAEPSLPKIKLHLKQPQATPYNLIIKERKPHNSFNFRDKIEASILEKYQDVVWKPWQQKVFDIIKSAPDNRTIHWFWDEIGNTGKTYIAKFIALTYKESVNSDGSQSVLFSGVSRMIKSGTIPKFALIDVPRSGKMNYGALVNIKDGKVPPNYIFPTLNVIVFASWEPDMEMISADRLNIVHI